MENIMSPSSKPLIGITGGLIRNRAGSPVCQLGQAYVTAVRKAGGVPIMIPVGMDENSLSSLLPKLDGVVLSGGGDIDPGRFNGKPHPKVDNVSPERDALEFLLLEKTLTGEKPLLAICRGIQVLNVFFDGELYTHISDQVEYAMKHDWYPDHPRDKLAHTVSLKCGSRLDQIFDADEIQVNSLHHQGISCVGRGLEATGYAPDGLVEGLEVKGTDFAVGVQWHPECLPEDKKMQGLFKAFISAC